MSRKVLTACLAVVLLVAASSGLAQTNLLAGAKWQYSTDGRTWAAQPPALDKSTQGSFLARCAFVAPDTSSLATLELDAGGGYGQRITHRLNGKAVPRPLQGMEYRTIPAIGPSAVKAGKNLLEVTIKYQGGKAQGAPLALPGKLLGLTDKDLKIVTGPVLGAFDKNFFTVTCRTNMPAKVLVFVAQITDPAQHSGREATLASSGEGLFHRLRVRRTRTIRQHTAYMLFATRADHRTQPVTLAPPALPREGLRFAVVGDSRSNPPAWAKVARAVIGAKPDLVLHSGDLVKYGRSDWQWNEQLFDPAKAMFKSIPFYPVLGNHDAKAPLYSKLFYGPGPDGDPVRWSQEINGVLLIGIDGYEKSPPGGKNAQWLEKTLAGTKAKFIFLVSHYPAWTSGTHGVLNSSGRPKEWMIRQGQDVIVPLLTKYKATAMFAGHDHVYERSELPGGLTHVTSAGAGAGLYKKTEDAEKQNPYSKVFQAVRHYCIVDVTGDTATLKAIDLNGKVIDSRTWSARQP